MDGRAEGGKRKKRHGKDMRATINADVIASRNECHNDSAENSQQEEISLSATASQPGKCTITTNSIHSFSFCKFSTAASLLHIA